MLKFTPPQQLHLLSILTSLLSTFLPISNKTQLNELRMPLELVTFLYAHSLHSVDEFLACTGITVLLYYCITVLLYYCITVLLYYCITALLYYCITVLLYYCITVLLYYCITVLLYYCITVLLYYWHIRLCRFSHFNNFIWLVCFFMFFWHVPHPIVWWQP